MIAVDTSALLAILFREPDEPRFRAEIASADGVIMSSVSLLEAGLVLRARHGQSAVETLGELIEDTGIMVVEFDRVQADLAIDAFGRFGKGLNPAGLNFGDCAVYALAKHFGVALLFKGLDFAATDISSTSRSP